MILIISNKSDSSTNQVIDWLNYYGKEVLRINGEDFFENLYSYHAYLDNTHVDLYSQTKFSSKMDMSKVEAIWFRRDSFIHFHNNFKEQFKNLSNTQFAEKLRAVLFQEFLYGKEASYNIAISNVNNVLGNYKNHTPNKIEVLNEAKKLGLRIPKTIITNNKDELSKFYKICNSQVITKPIKDVVTFNLEGNSFFQYTTKLEKKFFEKIQSHFFPTLFQELITKKYEIRTFFLRGTCYSMAIFSQLDRSTKIDFRQNNHTTKSRQVPFQLPKGIELKINKLMKNLNLNTGSIDIIRSKDGEYFFLEVNPVGQFGMTSAPCNYYLDQKIAKTLIQ